MPKVLRIINRLNLGGPTYNVAYLTKYLSPEFETLLLAGSKDQTEDSSEFILDNLGITPVIIPEMKREIDILNDRIAYKKIKEIIHQFKPDIVHTHASKAGTLGRIAAYNTHVPVILHTFHGHVFHSYFNPLKTNFFIRIERYLAKKSTAIIAVSEQQKVDLSEVYKICTPEKVKVIQLGFDLERFRVNSKEKRKEFRAKWSVNDDEIAIGIIGRLVKIKNHELFLKAIKIVSQKTKKKIRVFIIGDGEEKENLLSIAIELKIIDNHRNETDQKLGVTFTSWIRDIDCVLPGLDIMALSSLNEGTPVSLIEAQAASLPIVSTRVGGIENVVLPEITALLSDPFDVPGFADNILSLVENPLRRLEMSESGWDFVKNRFQYQILVENTSKLYRDLLD